MKSGPSEGRLAETGRVVAVSENAVEVEIAPSEACARCGLCSRGAGGDMRITVKAVAGLHVGSRVRLTFPYRSHWRQIWLVFGLPLVLFFIVGIAMSLAAERLALSSAAGGLVAIAAAGAGLAAGLLLARRSEKIFCGEVFEHTTVEPLDLD